MMNVNSYFQLSILQPSLKLLFSLKKKLTKKKNETASKFVTSQELEKIYLRKKSVFSR